MKNLLRCSLVLVLACLLAACQSGPGAQGCDPCEENAIANPDSGGAGAAAVGGQRAGQDPRATDTARIQPNTVIGRGTGPTESSVNNREGRVVASGAGVNQGLQIPNDATAQAPGGSVNPAVAEIQQSLRHNREMQAKAYGSGDFQTYKILMAEERDIRRDLMTAQAESGVRITNVYNQQGQRVVQSVVSGTDASDKAAISDTGAQAAATALGAGTKDVMTAPPEPAATQAPSTGSSAPTGDDPGVPPAGELPPGPPPLPEPEGGDGG